MRLSDTTPPAIMCAQVLRMQVISFSLLLLKISLLVSLDDGETNSESAPSLKLSSLYIAACGKNLARRSGPPACQILPKLVQRVAPVGEKPDFGALSNCNTAFSTTYWR